MSKWEQTLSSLSFSHGKINQDAKDAEDYLIKQAEIALKHPKTGAIVKLTDDGLIDIFAGPQLGLRMDPSTKSITLFGDNVNVLANNFNIKTKPYGFNWNGKVFNPDLYTKDDDDDIMTPAKTKVRYSEGMLDIMKELGLPVEDVDKEDD